MTDEHFPPLVLIEWLDSGQPMPNWQWLEQIEPRRPHLCVSVGFLVQDGDEAKVLAPNLGASDGGGTWDQASGVITIPTTAVQRMLRLNANVATLCPLASLPDDGDAPSALRLRAS